MPSRPKTADPTDLVQTWALPFAATLGSTVRAVGLFLEVRARLPVAGRKALTIKGRELTLRLPQGDAGAFATLSQRITTALEGIESLPLLPREIEDILAISTTERHRWLKDGRLPSAGTRTVSLRGRARKITFHVFEPQLVEDILDRGLVDTWREDDAATTAEKRRRAAWKAKLKRSAKNESAPVPASEDDARPNLRGWDEFEREGLLR
jgi:hypothetical protein